MLNFEQTIALAELYKLLTKKRALISRIRFILEKKHSKTILQQLTTKNMIDKGSVRLTLTAEGHEEGFKALRLITVMRNFYQNILGLSQKEADHYLAENYTGIDEPLIEKFCALIGHAHGDIPVAECCKRAELEISELVIPLSRLPVNTPATILFIKTSLHEETQKLFDLGLYPGRNIRIHQLYPTYIVFVEQQELALDRKIADAIYVRK